MTALPFDPRHYYTVDEFAALPEDKSARYELDPEPPVTATVYTLVDGEYEESQRAEHRFTVSEPCELAVDLDTLLPG